MVFIVAFGTMSLAWNIVNPFQLGILSGVDPSGKTLALAATVTGIGLAAGPAMGSMAIASGGYGAILWLAAGLAVVSFALLLLPIRRAKMAFSG
jgi:predicted MFS family arabinose efflux permease